MNNEISLCRRKRELNIKRFLDLNVLKKTYSMYIFDYRKIRIVLTIN